MSRSTTFTLSLLFLAASSLVAPDPIEAQTRVTDTPCLAPDESDRADIRVPDRIPAYRVARPTDVDRVEAHELARVAVPIVDGVVAEPLPTDEEITLIDVQRDRLADGTLTVRQMLIEQADSERLIPR